MTGLAAMLFLLTGTGVFACGLYRLVARSPRSREWIAAGLGLILLALGIAWWWPLIPLPTLE